MAKLEDMTVKVSIESVIHDALAALVQRLEAEHGFMVQNMHIEWGDVSTFEKRGAKVASIRVEATSHPGGAT